MQNDGKQVYSRHAAKFYTFGISTLIYIKKNICIMWSYAKVPISWFGWTANYGDAEEQPVFRLASVEVWAECAEARTTLAYAGTFRPNMGVEVSDTVVTCQSP